MSHLSNVSDCADLYKRAKKVTPGGVHSPVRSFKYVGEVPLFCKGAKGCHLYDEEGRAYIDYINGYGSIILGHADPRIAEIAAAVVLSEMPLGVPHRNEVLLVEKIIACVPSIEKLRLVNTGTEAAMTAIRLARAYTQKRSVIKFSGCYHGHSDGLLVDAGSGASTHNVPSSKGVLDSMVQDTILMPFNDLKPIEKLFVARKNQQHDIAAIIIEPIPGNMGMIMPDPDFLLGLRTLASQHGIVLIFDEVMTGFRVGLGGAQKIYQIKPDLTLLGKVIGGGFPVGAVGGRREIMDLLSPMGPVYQAGTFSGHPLMVAAGLEVLDRVSAPLFYETLQGCVTALKDGLHAIMRRHNIPFMAEGVGGMFGFYFTGQPIVSDYNAALRSNREHFNRFFHGLLANGIHLAPSPFEAGFMTTCHTTDVISRTLEVVDRVASGILEG
jgi:glutamate-1-semialdehyde 2,1-aminomutase